MNQLNVGIVAGLTEDEQKTLNDLVDVYNYHVSGNLEKDKYYEGHIKLSEVNLGIALPKGINKLEIGCEWGNKCVDVLASRSMFDGFVSSTGEDADAVRGIVEGNKLLAEYQKSTRDQLKFGCTFATLSADYKLGCKIRFHSPMTASALWDGEKGRIGSGLAIIDSVKDEEEENTWIPSVLNMYTDYAIIVITRYGENGWSAEHYPHNMGRPLMEALVWNATSKKPFGRSRIKEPVRRLIQGYVRTIANATIGLEFSTAPQKYLLGVTDEQYDAVIDNKFKQYVGSILASTVNPETGEKPTYGQLPQGNIQPHVEMIRILATQFSAATGLSVTDTGVVNDANPSSSDAILAQSQTLVLMAEQLNASNSNALKTIIQMAQAIIRKVPMDELTAEELDIIPHFKNPAMPTISMMADAAVKIASTREGFSQTDTFLEMMGFSQADIRRIKAQEARARGTQTITEEFSDADNTGSVG